MGLAQSWVAVLTAGLLGRRFARAFLAGVTLAGDDLVAGDGDAVLAGWVLGLLVRLDAGR